MSSNDDYTTPEKKRPSSPPAAPSKKRVKKSSAPTEKPILLITHKNDGDIATYSSNHPVLSGIRGHFTDIDLFLSDEVFESVIGIVGANGFSLVNRDMYLEEEVAKIKKRTLIKLFSRTAFGGGNAESGEMFRGTIVV